MGYPRSTFGSANHFSISLKKRSKDSERAVRKSVRLFLCFCVFWNVTKGAFLSVRLFLSERRGRDDIIVFEFWYVSFYVVLFFHL